MACIRHSTSTFVSWVPFHLSAAPLPKTLHEDICLRQCGIFTSSFELTRNVLVLGLSIFGCPSTYGLRRQKSKICICNLFTRSWSAKHCERLIGIDLLNGTPRPAFLRCSAAKRQRCLCIYYFNTTTTFCSLLLGNFSG